MLLLILPCTRWPLPQPPKGNYQFYGAERFRLSQLPPKNNKPPARFVRHGRALAIEDSAKGENVCMRCSGS